MPRKPQEIVPIMVRLRERLRRRLEMAAKKRAVSLNQEIADRLTRSFEQETVRDLDKITSDFGEVLAWRRQFAGEFPLLSAGMELIAALRDHPQLKADPKIEAAISKMQKAIDNSAVVAPFGARLTGDR